MKLNAIRWELEPTCNLNCKHCFVGKDSLIYPERVDLKVGLNVIDNLYKFGVKEIFFTTREPLLNPYICEYIERCSGYGIKTSLITNGICLADEDLSNRLIESGLCAISISLEGATEETNDKIRGKYSFKKTMLGIEVFQRRLCTHHAVMPFNLQMSLNSYNSTICGKLSTLINKLPFDSISIGALSNTGNARLNQEIILSDDKYFELFSIIAREYLKITRPNFVLIFKSLMPWEAVLLKILTGYDIYPVTPHCSILGGTYSMLPDCNIVPCISLVNDGMYRSVNGNNSALTENLLSAFSGCIEDLRVTDEKMKKEYCAGCYFASKCFLCPALAKDKKMRDAALLRCIDAKIKTEKYFESRYTQGCYLDLDQAQVLFTYREAIFQKNYADSVKKEFRFQLASEDVHFIEALIHGTLFRKQSFQSENNIIRSLIIEGVIALRGGLNNE